MIFIITRWVFLQGEQLKVYILTWSHIIICSSKPINQEDLRVTPLSLSVLLIFKSLVLISWTSWFLLQGFLPLAPAPEERMRQLEHQSPLCRACFHKMERITNNNSSPETASLEQDSTPKLMHTLTLTPKATSTISFALNSFGVCIVGSPCTHGIFNAKLLLLSFWPRRTAYSLTVIIFNAVHRLPPGSPPQVHDFKLYYSSL